VGLVRQFSCWRAGIAEYWLIDARRERLVFRIHVRGADGYEPAPVDGEGCQLSAVFAVSFRLERRRGTRGRWVFELQVI
jgi:Uma2 family endonuclease